MLFFFLDNMASKSESEQVSYSMLDFDDLKLLSDCKESFVGILTTRTSLKSIWDQLTRVEQVVFPTYFLKICIWKLVYTTFIINNEIIHWFSSIFYAGHTIDHYNILATRVTTVIKTSQTSFWRVIGI